MNDQDLEGISLGSSSLETGSKARSIATSREYVKTATKSYQTKAENIHMMQEVEQDTKLRSSFESSDNVDNVLSGESLYKTYTFEQSCNEDVEKCVSFWKSIMQKNLEPIKCTIIETSKAKAAPPEPQKKESDAAIVENQRKLIREAEEKVHEYYKDLWMNALEELQRKGLDKIKLIGKSRCRMCESETPPTEDTDSGVDKEEIVGLNVWKPKPKEKRKSEVGVKEKERKLSVQQLKSEVEVLHKAADNEACVCEFSDSVSQETIVLDHTRVKPDTNRYKLIDLINEKRKADVYSRWRKNNMKPCTCGVSTCDCNINPAIVSVNPLDVSCSCGELICQCKKVSKTEQDKESVVQAVEDIDKTSAELHPCCMCGNPNCTCKESESKYTQDSENLQDIEQSSALEASAEILSGKYSDTTLSIKSDEEDVYKHKLYIEPPGPIKRDSRSNVTNFGTELDTESLASYTSCTSGKQICTCEHEICECKKYKHKMERVKNKKKLKGK